ncbi:hypothetical protein K438DRAFT_2118931 [Mycena galopus ATCC 62051]|nr:hypothetical protein K438DRAFT_2118931 [Mycena galopus ATCC 62051]
MCATTEVLDAFLTQTYQAKTTMYDFYSVLEKLTNNAGIKPPNRYHVFLRMVREYSHLLMLKRGGRGHARSGVLGTKQGGLVVRCPACPQPGENLPDDWEDAPPGSQFLYIMFLAIDACFRLKRRMVSSELKDPSLGPGWSYMVETTAYCSFLLSITNQQEMSTCSRLAALDYANTKFSRGYSATGMGMGVCACHELVLPNGVGDLQRGERYGNMDWIVTCIFLHLHARLRKIFSYDIACQWSRKLKSRLAKLPSSVALTLILVFVCFAVPKMHIKGHLINCQEEFSLNLIPGSGQTCGEGIERPWAHIGAVGSSTKEMGPGSREDTLNGHWGSWNWQKIVGMGEWVFGMILRAQRTDLPAWRVMVEEYEAGRGKNPYRMSKHGITEAEVLLQFEQEEAQRIQAGVPSIHSVSPGTFISAGLEIEDSQHHVRVQVELKKAGTTAQKIDVLALRRALNGSIQRFRKLQATYTPVAILALARRQNVPVDEQSENVPLFLPSALTQAERSSDAMKALAAIENALRDAQCSMALERLRLQLHIKSRLFLYKELQARNQGANTRARTIVTRNESKVQLHSEKYQMAWEARCLLADGDAGKVGWHALKKEDIRCMEDAEDLARNEEKRKGQEERRKHRENELRRQGELPPLTREERERAAQSGESVREVSWIWMGAGTTRSDADLDEGTRMFSGWNLLNTADESFQHCVLSGASHMHVQEDGRKK